ncbi:hypothetical protein DYP60_02375 [Sphaerochaeta halotolerans]|uniref:Uncharacterized protein n=1 Tax=Sphaerochaeta halotolerans TaxID=2293840 RepID=A0A372ML07_9SPIR|nr:hypothetical protein DYP60_02375 [Sphaerochaeta halotolerans]
MLGIGYIVNPNAETARSIFKIIKQGVNGTVLAFSNSKLLLYNFYTEEHSTYVGSPIRDNHSRERYS